MADDNLTKEKDAATNGSDFAFPNAGDDKRGWAPTSGVSKREYFAAAALQGLLACPHQMCNDIYNQTALAVEFADRLLLELQQ